MLVLKKIGKTKLILYFIIFSLMLGGTGFFLYQNYKLTLSTGISVMDKPAENGEINELDLDKIKIELGEDISTSSAEDINDKNLEEESTLSQTKTEKQVQLVDLELLNNNKFKKLKYNSIDPVDFVVGKKNPFESN